MILNRLIHLRQELFVYLVSHQNSCMAYFNFLRGNLAIMWLQHYLVNNGPLYIIIFDNLIHSVSTYKCHVYK